MVYYDRLAILCRICQKKNILIFLVNKMACIIGPFSSLYFTYQRFFKELFQIPIHS